MKKIFAIILFLFTLSAVFAVDNKQLRTEYPGWNTVCERYHLDIRDNRLIKYRMTGYRQLGYKVSMGYDILTSTWGLSDFVSRLRMLSAEESKDYKKIYNLLLRCVPVSYMRE
jgi:hypothetical protein